jgi:predicted TIM-barrel fold metal-dependent hydrolase
MYAHSSVVFLENKEKRQVFRLGREQLEKEHGVRLRSFDDFVTLVGEVFERAGQNGAVAAKSVAAYRRTLSFDPVGRSEAERAFSKSDGEIAPSEVKAFQDYAMHLIVQKATEHKLPLQIHTGIQHGYGGVLADSNPLHLTGLLAGHPDARFVLFHGSYPFGGELSVLAKTFANVYLDFSFLPLLSPAVAERNLLEWLDTVPRSKLGWGGDCQHVEELYGHVLGFREVVARVLAQKVERGDLGRGAAVDLASKLLRDNVWEIYDLERKRGDRTLDW